MDYNKNLSLGISSKQITSSNNVSLLLIGLVMGGIFFVAAFGVKILNPEYIDWRFKIGGDAARMFLGWEFFRYEDWHFPIGYIKNYGYPLGTTIGLVSSLSLLAIPFKLINNFLPVKFQYFGIWILSCYLLQGFFGVLLMQKITKNLLLIVLGAVFFICSPVMFFRAEGHNELVSHWVVLYAMWLNFSIFSNDSKKFHWLFLTCLTTLMHPYLWVMVLGLFVSDNLNSIYVRKNLSIQKSLKNSCIVIGLNLLLLWQAGYFYNGVQKLGASGFGDYSLNLNALFNPMGFSYFLKEYPLKAGQYEAFSYLGLGIIIALIVVLLSNQQLRVRKVLQTQWPFLGILCLYLIYAISFQLSINQYRLLKIPIHIPLFDMFRASGRFIWPVYYALVFAILYMFINYLLKNFSVKKSYIILSLLVSIQLVDILDSPRAMLWKKEYYGMYTWHTTLQSSFWKKAKSKGYNKIIFIPNDQLLPVLHNAKLYHKFVDIAFFAASNKLSISNGSFRGPRFSFLKDFITGNIDPHAIYIIDDKLVDSYSSRFDIKHIDGWNVFIQQNSENIEKDF